MLPVVFLGLVDDSDLPKFEKLYKEFRKQAYIEAYKILKNKEQAEECTAEAFLSAAKMYKKIGEMPFEEQKKYMYIAVRNKAIDIRRTEKLYNGSEPYDDAVYFDQEKYKEEDLLVFKESIRELSQTDQYILYMISVQGLTYKDVAKTLNITYNAAKQRFWTAKTRLKSILEGKDGENGK